MCGVAADHGSFLTAAYAPVANRRHSLLCPMVILYKLGVQKISGVYHQRSFSHAGRVLIICIFIKCPTKTHTYIQTNSIQGICRAQKGRDPSLRQSVARRVGCRDEVTL